MSLTTFKFRIKDASTAKRLDRYAVAANQVWNFCVATQREAERRRKMGSPAKWPTAFDLINLTSGSSVALDLHADSIQAICRQFAASRDLHRFRPHFRASGGAKRALGWVPYIRRTVRLDGDGFVYRGQRFRMWKSREIIGQLKVGAFVEDSRGRWYATFTCEVPDDLPCGNGEIGIDLGLKELATLNTGEKIPALQHYRKYEATLGRAQRARNRKRVQAIAAKISNARKHHLHVQSARLADQNSLIVVGNVKAATLAKTKMAKSVLDAGWSTFRHMLRYKIARRQAAFVEVDEQFTTQVCSECGTLPASRPKGIAGLGIRRWDCSDCGASHDRDVNAARNILYAGLKRQPPAGEILLASGRH